MFGPAFFFFFVAVEVVCYAFLALLFVGLSCVLYSMYVSFNGFSAQCMTV
jgi:hypothetical protein